MTYPHRLPISTNVLKKLRKKREQTGITIQRIADDILEDGLKDIEVGKNE